MLLLALLLAIEIPFRFASLDLPLVLIDVSINGGPPWYRDINQDQRQIDRSKAKGNLDSQK